MYEKSRVAEKSNIQNSVNSTVNCIHYMYGISGFVKKLNIQNYENSMGNCVHYMCTKSQDLLKIWISRTTKIEWQIVYIIYVRNILIRRKFEYLELRKFNWKLCTLYIYKMSWFPENLNIQSCGNSTENFVCYICTECVD